MSESELTREEQVGLHIALTAAALALLEGDVSVDLIELKMSKAIKWYQNRCHLISIFLHEEPLYNAAQIRGKDLHELDRLSDELWGKYNLVSDILAKGIFHGDFDEIRRKSLHGAALVMNNSNSAHIYTLDGNF